MAFNQTEYDANGWAPIHHAAYRGSLKTLDKLLHAIDADATALLGLKTEDGLGSTPLLLAVTGARLDAVLWIIDMGADVTAVNLHNQGVVELAAMAGYREYTGRVSGTAEQGNTDGEEEEKQSELTVQLLK